MVSKPQVSGELSPPTGDLAGNSFNPVFPRGTGAPLAYFLSLAALGPCLAKKCSGSPSPMDEIDFSEVGLSPRGTR